MRRRRGWRRWISAVGLSAALMFTPPADATVAVRLSRQEQVSLSDVVVRVTVLGRTSRWSDDGAQIVSLTRLQVTEVYKGSIAPGAELTLRQFGGEVDGLRSRIAGDPQLQRGADAVVFLRQGPGVVFLTAMAQSVYYVSAPGASGAVSAPGVSSVSSSGVPVAASGGSAVAWRDLHGLTFARVVPGAPMQLTEPDAEAPEPLARLAAELRALAGASR